jgi:hypothetical protein
MKRTKEQVLMEWRRRHLQAILRRFKTRLTLRKYKLSLDKNKPNIEQL